MDSSSRASDTFMRKVPASMPNLAWNASSLLQRRGRSPGCGQSHSGLACPYPASYSQLYKPNLTGQHCQGRAHSWCFCGRAACTSVGGEDSKVILLSVAVTMRLLVEVSGALAHPTMTIYHPCTGSVPLGASYGSSGVVPCVIKELRGPSPHIILKI